MSAHLKKQPKEHIQVFVRCRPLLKSELSLPVPVEVHPGVNKILVRDTGTDKCTVKSFSFDRVFGQDAKQADIYAEVVAPIIQEVIMGFNCTIFAYGQTGTGKTFTIEGGRTQNLKDISEDPLCGIIPRSMKHLFNDLTEQKRRFQICVSFLELYNEEIFDLLSKTDDSVKLRMYDNSSQKGSVIVQGLEVRPVTSMMEVYAILDTGFKKRRKAATLLNKASSRSHTVFTVTVNIKESSSAFEETKIGKLNLVDLAGSENIGRSGAIDKRAREAGNINQSLLALGRVITSLCEKAGHIPYRESKLTRLLQDSLGGQTKTAVIATISPSSIHIDETLNTLEYALRAKNITNKPELNTQVTLTTLTKDYLEEKNRLIKGIYEWVTKNGFYVPGENLRHWESTLASKREEKFKIISQIKNLMEENKSLDNAIQDANNNLTEKRNQLEDAKLSCEEYRQKLVKAKEDHKLHEAMLKVMQPLSDQLHNKLHEEFEEKQRVESEVFKKKEKLRSSVEELRNQREKLQNMRQSQKQRKEKLHLNAENLLSNIKNMHDSVNSLTSECNNYISLLKNGFESTTMLCENEFNTLFRAVGDLEAIGKSFQVNIELALNEEKSTKLKGIDEFYEAYLSSSEVSVLDPLNNTLKDCESSLHGISSAINDWRTLISSEMNARQNIMNEHLDNQNTTLESMTDCINALLKKQKENLEAYNDVIVECVNSEASSKTLWSDKFLSVERALSSLDLFCTDHMQSKVDKAFQASMFLKNYSRLGSEIAEKLTSYCESSVKNIDVVQREIDLHELNAFSGKWEEMKKRVDVSCMKYKDLNSELARFSSISQNVDGLLNHFEDTLKNKFTAIEKPAVSTCSQEMINTILKRGDSYRTHLLNNQTEVDALLSKNRALVEKLTESFKLLSSSVNKKVHGHIQCIETELRKTLTEEENTEATDNRVDGNTIENTSFDVDITITSSECLEDASVVNGSECPVCSNKISDETLNNGENGSNVPVIVQCSKNPSQSPVNANKVQPEASGSRSFVSHFPRSPIRRPRGRNALPVRRNLQFLHIEKLAHQLLQSSSDEEM